MLNRTVAPPFKKIEKIDIQKAQSVRLTNHIPFHQIKAGKQPVVRLEMFLHSGKWFEPQEGLSFFTAKMINEGTENRTANQISNYIDQFGAYLEITPGFDYNTLAIYSLEKYLPDLIPLLQELLFSASFPEEELAIMKNMVRQELKLKLEKSSILAYKKFRELLFHDHPYGQDLEPEHLKIITTSHLQQYYQTNFRNKPEILLSGSFNFEKTKKLIEDHFGSIKYPERLPDNVDIKYKPQALVVDKPKSTQSSLKIGKLLFNKTHPEYLKMLIVNEILGGYFGSRLMKNIREEKGYTYGIYSRMVNFRTAGYFMISADVKKEFTQLALEEIYKEIKKLQELPVPEDELEIVKNQMLGSFLNEINSPFALAEKFKMVHYHNLGYSFYQQFIETINTITADEVMQTAKKHLSRETMTEVVVGGLS